jgi:FtsH-binding integral membrane protein
MSYGLTVKSCESHIARVYWFALSICLVLGFSINYVMIKNIPAEAILEINPWVLIIGYFICAFTGIFMSMKSSDPVISFIGYMLVVVPVGVVITPFVQSVDPAIVEKAVLFTALLSAGMGIVGMLFPAFFASIGGILTVSLLIAIIAEIGLMFFGYDLKAMDWIVAIIFLGFIAYDFSQALDDEPTLDAAVDRAVALYLDIINLFLRILSIMKED